MLCDQRGHVAEKLTCMPGVARKLTRTADRTVMLLLSLSPADFVIVNRCTAKEEEKMLFSTSLTCSPVIIPRQSARGYPKKNVVYSLKKYRTRKQLFVEPVEQWCSIVEPVERRAMRSTLTQPTAFLTSLMSSRLSVRFTKRLGWNSVPSSPLSQSII